MKIYLVLTSLSHLTLAAFLLYRKNHYTNSMLTDPYPPSVYNNDNYKSNLKIEKKSFQIVN